jgi:poly(glycerol-phosphate) alpha-glucosyltransferase
VIFVGRGLGLQKGGLTKAFLSRIRLFSEAGWQVQVALTSADAQIDETLLGLTADGRLPESVTVHLFQRERDSRRRQRVLGLLGIPTVGTEEAWLDRLAADDGALVFADTPETYAILARMRHPLIARVYVVHLCHLAAEATRLASPHEIANGPTTKRWSELSEAAIRAADRIVVLTHAQQEDFRLRWGRDLPVEVIPHCVPWVGAVPSVPRDPRLVVGLGRLGYQKRWDDAIRVMARVIDDVPDARLEIHGIGDDADRLAALTDELGLTGSVTFAGYTTRPLEVLAGATCTISTSRREAMPLVLLEGLSVGTPAVVHDIRYGPSEIVRDGVDGFIVPVGDVAAAAAAVVRLLTERDLAQRMSRSARDVTDRFSRQAHDEAWLALGHDLHDHRGVASTRG